MASIIARLAILVINPYVSIKETFPLNILYMSVFYLPYIIDGIIELQYTISTRILLDRFRFLNEYLSSMIEKRTPFVVGKHERFTPRSLIIFTFIFSMVSM